MKYVCSVCGYVYDEEKENKLFSDLPDTWACPWCKAPKALFGPKEDGPGEAAAAERTEAVQSGSEEEDALGTEAAGESMASAGELSVMCSNLARGCEKQYRPEEEALFRQLAEYFAARIPDVDDAGMEQLASMTARDLAEGYPALSGGTGKGRPGHPEDLYMGREGHPDPGRLDQPLHKGGQRVPERHGCVGLFCVRFHLYRRHSPGAVSGLQGAGLEV